MSESSTHTILTQLLEKSAVAAIETILAAGREPWNANPHRRGVISDPEDDPVALAVRAAMPFESIQHDARLSKMADVCAGIYQWESPEGNILRAASIAFSRRALRQKAVTGYDALARIDLIIEDMVTSGDADEVVAALRLTREDLHSAQAALSPKEPESKNEITA